jgi:hypothetical protein
MRPKRSHFFRIGTLAFVLRVILNVGADASSKLDEVREIAVG